MNHARPAASSTPARRRPPIHSHDEDAVVPHADVDGSAGCSQHGCSDDEDTQAVGILFFCARVCAFVRDPPLFGAALKTPEMSSSSPPQQPTTLAASSPAAAWAFSLAAVGVAVMLAVVFASSNLAYFYAARFGGSVALNAAHPLQFDATTGALKMPTAEELQRIDESAAHYREALSTMLWIGVLVLVIALVFYATIYARSQRQQQSPPPRNPSRAPVTRA
jgi:hypothetical protein